MFQNTRKMQAVLEALSVASISALAIFIASIDIENNFTNNISVTSITIHIVLSICAYTLLRIIFSKFTSILIFSFICILLHYSSTQKYLHTKEPLISNDIFSLSLLHIGSMYADTSTMSLVLLSISILLIMSVFHWKKIGFFIVIVRTIIFTLAMYSTSIIFNNTKEYTSGLLSDFGITYYNWDMPVNFNTNGIFIHLFQTTVRNIPSKPNSDEWDNFISLIPRPAINATRRMIIILCEACWYEKDRFYDEFSPLVKLGATEMRGISPVYGGGTPNATIELMSGLPVRNSAVTGVLYHEYRDLFASRTWTLPYQLKSSGYITASMHNYYKDFWYRSRVEPKLGLSEFYGIEDMPAEKTGEDWPRDKVVYDYAREFLKGEGRK